LDHRVEVGRPDLGARPDEFGYRFVVLVRPAGLAEPPEIRSNLLLGLLAPVVERVEDLLGGKVVDVEPSALLTFALFFFHELLEAAPFEEQVPDLAEPRSAGGSVERDPGPDDYDQPLGLSPHRRIINFCGIYGVRGGDDERPIRAGAGVVRGRRRWSV